MQVLPITFESLAYRAPTGVAKTLRFHTPAAQVGVKLFLQDTGSSSQDIGRTESRCPR